MKTRAQTSKGEGDGDSLVPCKRDVHEKFNDQPNKTYKVPLSEIESEWVSFLRSR